MARRNGVFGNLITLLVRPGLLRDAKTADGKPLGYGHIVNNVVALMVPVALTLGIFTGTWWYVVIHNAPAAAAVAKSQTAPEVRSPAQSAPAPVEKPQELGSSSDKPQVSTSVEEQATELGQAETTVQPTEPSTPADAPPQEMGSLGEPSAAAAAGKVPENFYAWFWSFALFSALLLALYYRRMDGEQFEILKELSISVVPLGVLTIIVLAVILLGICTATESAAVGALGALYLAVLVKYPRSCGWWSLAGGVVGVALGIPRGDLAALVVSSSLGAVFLGTVVPMAHYLPKSSELRRNLQEAVFLTAKTTAMVCWLFIGSALFSSVFALHGGQGLIERWVLGMNLSPLGFLFVSQMIIFLLGWPLEWTEIIVIFCPIFIPLLSSFQRRPDPVRHHGRGQSAGGIFIAAGGHVGFLLERCFAIPRHSQSDFRRHDAVHAYRLSLSSLHVRLAGHDLVAAGVLIRKLKSSNRSSRSSRSKRPIEPNPH